MQIVAKGLKFSYNKDAKFRRDALNGVDLVISDGDFFGIIGETGSGKSTFIQHLNGLIPVQQGTFTVGDFDLSYGVKKDKKRLKELRRRVGMVFQYPEYQLFAETVFEDVAFGLKNFYPDLKKEEIVKRVGDALTAVGLNYNEVKDKTPFSLSGGQKRRVAIAGVIVTRPEVLVLDEPVAGLDPEGKRNLMKTLRELKKDFVKTIIIVSHDMDEVLENCNAAAAFSGGKAVKIGAPKEIFKDEKLVETLRLNEPVTAYIENKINENGVNFSGGVNLTDFTRDVISLIKSR